MTALPFRVPWVFSEPSRMYKESIPLKFYPSGNKFVNVLQYTVNEMFMPRVKEIENTDNVTHFHFW
jgi:hypothetical protein